MSDPIYLDYNATAPMRPGVKDFYVSLLDVPGNASSVHEYGRNARKHIETAREQIAQLVNTPSKDVIFNSGATEANNTILNAYMGGGVLVSAGEHPSIFEAPHDDMIIPLTADGVVDLVEFQNLISRSPPPSLVSVMMVNNETGVINPIREISEICHDRGVKFHTDATQAAGRIPIDLEEINADYLTLSSHKLGGPQGVGALIATKESRAPPLLTGGGQEKYKRAGTENVVGIAAFGAAAEHAKNHIEDFQKLIHLRHKLEDGLKDITNDIVIFGEHVERVANTTCCAIPGLNAETTLIALDLEHIAISSGSACSSGKVAKSHVLEAMGTDDNLMIGALRISTGWGTEETHIDKLLNALETIIKRVRN